MGGGYICIMCWYGSRSILGLTRLISSIRFICAARKLAKIEQVSDAETMPRRLSYSVKRNISMCTVKMDFNYFKIYLNNWILLERHWKKFGHSNYLLNCVHAIMNKVKLNFLYALSWKPLIIMY